MQQTSDMPKKLKKFTKSITKTPKKNATKSKKISKKKEKQQDTEQTLAVHTYSSRHNDECDKVGQYTRMVRFTKFVQQLVAKEAEKTGGIICMPGELPPQAETAESMGYTRPEEMRFAKRFYLQARSLLHETVFTKYKLVNVLCKLQGKKTAGIDMVHALRFLREGLNPKIQKIINMDPAGNIRAIISDHMCTKDESAKLEHNSNNTTSEIMKSLSLIDITNVNEIMESDEALKSFILDHVGEYVSAQIHNCINAQQTQ